MSLVAAAGAADACGFPIVMPVPHRIVRAWLEAPAAGIIELDRDWTGAEPPRFTLGWHCPAPQALQAAPGTTAVLNAANEVAVAAFLERRIRFDQIHALNLATLSAVQPEHPRSLDDLLALDARSRRVATERIGCCQSIDVGVDGGHF